METAVRALVAYREKVKESERMTVQRKDGAFYSSYTGAGAVSGSHRPLRAPIRSVQEARSHHATYGLLIRGGAAAGSRRVRRWGTVWLIRPGADRSIFFVKFSEPCLSLCFFV